MGCDIHMYVEHRAKKPTSDYEKRWSSFGGRINPGRNYTIFANLAGVRGEGPEPKGCPEDLGWSASHDNNIYISAEPSDSSVSPETAKRYVESCGSHYIQNREGVNTWVTHPDWHSHSWATVTELAHAVASAEKGDKWGGPYVMHEYRALIAAMRSLAANGREVRVVYWFDN